MFRSLDSSENITTDDEEFIDSIIMYINLEDVKLTDLEVRSDEEKIRILKANHKGLAEEGGYQGINSLVYSYDAKIPIELTLESYQVMMTKQKWTTDKLLEFQIKQIKGLIYELNKAQKKKDVNKEPIGVGDLMLVYDSTLDNSLRKFDYRWNRLYVVKEIGKHGQYYLAE
ncbi:1148_t:CDS:2, partial [Scutellospora calospora]